MKVSGVVVFCLKDRDGGPGLRGKYSRSRNALPAPL
jgi:hypothetical protein